MGFTPRHEGSPNKETGDVFCLVEAPSKEAAIQVHREAHGLLPDDITEVVEGR